MNEKILGRLEKVELRDFWESESAEFTPWLAQDENITLLADAIGLELEVEAQEKNVGPFRADILCKDISTDNWVLIENQLERTDHTHLGQLMTYAAGLNAVTIVWVSAKFTEEHRAALDWLNEITDESFNFFGLEVELWRIGDSMAAPKFNIVSKPNEWSRTIAGAAKASQQAELTEKKQLQLGFWTGFRDYLESVDTPLVATKPFPQHWMNLKLGKSGTQQSAIASFYNSEQQTYDVGEIRAEVALTDKDAKGYFALLERQKSDIEAELGKSLTWHNPDSKVACRIYLSHSADLYDRDKWPEYFQWLRDNLESLRRVFRKRIQKLDLSELQEIEEA